MTRSTARFFCIPLFLSALVCCGATTTSSGGDGGPGGSCPTNLSGEPAGRPTGGMCAATTTVPNASGDGGATSCATNADCGTGTLYQWCRAGKCEPDQCFTDADCPSGQACSCADEQVGNAVHTNVCVQAQCRVDSDCGSGEACSRTVQDLCSGSGPGFACHSSADRCRVDADCCSSAPACRYQPMVGHWECVAACRIAG